MAAHRMMKTKKRKKHSMESAGHESKSPLPTVLIGLPIDASNTVATGQSGPRLASLYPKAELKGSQMTKKNIQPRMTTPSRMRKGAMSCMMTCGRVRQP